MGTASTTVPDGTAMVSPSNSRLSFIEVTLLKSKCVMALLLKVLKDGRKNKQSDLTTPLKVRAAARAMAADTMASQVDNEWYYSNCGMV